MADFWQAATTPVALVFFIPLAVSLIAWLISMLGLFEADADSLDGIGGEAMDSVGLGDAPPLLALTVVSAIAWFLAVVAALFVLEPLAGVGLTIASIVVLVVAAVAAVWIGGYIVRPVGRMMEPALAPSAAELVGREAVVRSGRVDESFGYADALWPDGSESRIDIRDANGLGLGPGDHVRLISWDATTSTYAVSSDEHLFDG